MLGTTGNAEHLQYLVANGLIAKEIAGKLNLSTHTVYTHRKNTMKKLRLGSVSELVRYALSEGIV